MLERVVGLLLFLMVACRSRLGLALELPNVHACGGMGSGGRCLRAASHQGTVWAVGVK